MPRPQFASKPGITVERESPRHNPSGIAAAQPPRTLDSEAVRLLLGKETNDLALLLVDQESPKLRLLQDSRCLPIVGRYLGGFDRSRPCYKCHFMCLTKELEC